jgi:hypothetical protein
VAAAVLGSALVGLTGLHTAAAADPPTTTTTVTLPLFGAPLTMDVTTGPGGNISNVSVDPADNTVATTLKPHKVVFQSANPSDPSADPARVTIKSRFGGQSISARAGSLGDVSGPGSWAGDLFATGTNTTVNFTVGAGSDGNPDITGVTSSDSSAVIGEVKHFAGGDDHHEGDEGHAAAWVSIKFTSSGGDQSRMLTIAVKVHTGEDHSGAKVSITLSRIHGVAQDAATVAGPHTWSGSLCDGTAASIAYTVAADGTVSDVTVTPDTATVHTKGGGIAAKFSNHEWVMISVREHDGMIKISSFPMLRCKTEAPTTSVDVSLPPPTDQPDNGWWGQGGGYGGHHRGGGNNTGG